MSVILCHYLHGKRVLQSHMEQIPDRDAFLLGAQGPAVFDYGLLFLKEPNIQAQFCRNLFSPASIERLLEFSEKSCKTDDKTFFSYGLGVFCYCLLEQEITPFVAYGSEMMHRLEPELPVAACKNRIESALDVILLRYETGQLPTEINFKTTVPITEESRNAAVIFYQHFLEQFSDDTVNKEVLKDLFSEGVKGIGKLNDKTLLKRQLLKRREKRHKQHDGISNMYRNISEDGNYDYANVCQNEWQWPIEDGMIRTETFFDLFEKAATRTEQLFKNVK